MPHEFDIFKTIHVFDQLEVWDQCRTFVPMFRYIYFKCGNYVLAIGMQVLSFTRSVRQRRRNQEEKESTQCIRSSIEYTLQEENYAIRFKFCPSFWIYNSKYGKCRCQN